MAEETQFPKQAEKIAAAIDALVAAHKKAIRTVVLAKMATDLGVSVATIYNWIAGSSLPRKPRTAAEYLGLDLDDVVADEES